MPNKVESNKNYPIISKSDEYYKVALDLIPALLKHLQKVRNKMLKVLPLNI